MCVFSTPSPLIALLICSIKGGGLIWLGPTTCQPDQECFFINIYVSQCLPRSYESSSGYSLISTATKTSTSSVQSSTSKAPTTTLVTTKSAKTTLITSTTSTTSTYAGVPLWGQCKPPPNPFSLLSCFTHVKSCVDAVDDMYRWRNQLDRRDLLRRRSHLRVSEPIPLAMLDRQQHFVHCGFDIDDADQHNFCYANVYGCVFAEVGAM